MNELTIQGESTFSLSPRNLAEAMEFAKIIAQSDMVPKDYVNKPGNVLVAVQTGAELGLKPMQSLQGISVINGRPSIWGDAMRALVISHPEFEDLHEDKHDTHCTVTLKRRGRSEVVTTFTMEDAKKAGLAGKSGPWQTAPKRMLQMRAFAFAGCISTPSASRSWSCGPTVLCAGRKDSHRGRRCCSAQMATRWWRSCSREQINSSERTKSASPKPPGSFSGPRKATG